MFVLIGPDVRQDLREQRRTLALYIRAIIYLKREFDVLKYFSELGFQYFNTKRPGEKEKLKKTPERQKAAGGRVGMGKHGSKIA